MLTKNILNPEERVSFLMVPDEGGGSESPPEENPEIAFEDDTDDEIIISDEPLEDDTSSDPAPDVTKEDLLSRIESMQEQMQNAQQRGDEVSALREGIGELAKSMKSAPSERDLQGQQSQQPQESEDEYRKKFNENFYDDPYSYMQDFTMKKLGPEFNRILSTQEKMFRKEIQRDPSRKDTYSKYKDEIEEEYQQIPQYQRMTDPDAMAKAHDRVVSRHIDDIVQQKVQEALQEQQGSGQQNQRRQGANRQSSQPLYAESSNTPKPTGGQKRQPKRLSTREARWADNKGLPYDKALEILSRKPNLKEKINGNR